MSIAKRPNPVWIPEKVKALALTCSRRVDFFRKSSSAYRAAKVLGMFDEVTSHMPKNTCIGSKSNGYKWSKEAVSEEAKLYSRRKDFQKGSAGAYDRAVKQKWLDEACSHMKTLSRQWTAEDLRVEALKFDSRSEFIKKSYTARGAAIKMGIYEKICSHMKLLKIRCYSVRQITSAAKKFKTRTDFAKGEPSMYGKCCKLGILDTVCAHMTYDHYPWKDSELEDLVKKYKTLLEFRTAHSGAYATIFLRGLQLKLLDHFPKTMTTSTPEIAILRLVRETFPEAVKRKDHNIKIEGRPYIHAFELDIYVRELKKGIEFDGTYYHSYEHMRGSEGRKKWPDQALREYHEIKDAYFLTKGITLLHITEKDWKLDQEACLARVSEFLCAK